MFSDDEILQIAYELYGQEGDLDTVHAWREHLCPETVGLERIVSDLLP